MQAYFAAWELGDFAVLYRANGMLTDVKQLLSARSRLNGTILDCLHQAGVEIVSPNFMNTRDVSGQTFASQPVIKRSPPAESKEPEEIIFDKADQAETLEEQKAYLEEVETQLEALEGDHSKASDEQKSGINEAMTKFGINRSNCKTRYRLTKKRWIRKSIN